jgi:hypothetical protein
MLPAFMSPPSPFYDAARAVKHQAFHAPKEWGAFRPELRPERMPLTLYPRFMAHQEHRRRRSRAAPVQERSEWRGPGSVESHYSETENMFI